MTILSIKNLSKIYPKKQALHEINLQIKQGEIIALIGPNGAGKSTLMKIICDLAKASSGTYTWSFNGKSSAQATLKTNIIENPDLFPYLTGYEILQYFAIQRQIYDQNQITQILQQVNLESAKDLKYKNYSMGMKQRLAVGLAMLGQPRVMILDEPTNGIDVQGLVDLRKVFVSLNQKLNTTQIISSHNLNELYTIAHRFIFLKQGRIIQDISKENLIHALDHENIEQYYLNLMKEEH
ncbi:ABC transporter ATP-binding protein [Facklamia sp. DSM 111018]|uniref:ABC transporter ATP-binding protein n=1 Tax=Facklamia lactis TaxID=2749967 RepID=A0ABS0LNR3_9LACT|nr:ABC transporter ATP-binding protein [Facklamia lactis]MBG9985805.1 ABC transporter ATP-binding protein [Facklamia lactis]